MYPLKIRCQESVRKTVHTVKCLWNLMSMEFLTERMLAEAVVRVLGEKKGD